MTMLPNAKNTLIAGLAALTLATGVAAPALAWGKKEQGFVAGAATAIIVDQMIKNGRHRQEHRYDDGYRGPHRGGPGYGGPVYGGPTYVEPPRYVEPRRSYSTSVYATPAAKAFNSYSPVERRAIQRRLKASGYYYGGIDGAFGPGTYNAVVSYARAAGAAGHLNSTNGAFAIYDGMLF